MIEPQALQTHQPPHEVMRLALGRGGAGRLSASLGVSPWTARSWCRPPGVPSSTDTGRKSPLLLVEKTCLFLMEEGRPEAARSVARHISRVCGGVFIALPVSAGGADSEAVQNMSASLKEVGEFVESFRSSWFDSTPGRICPASELPAVLREGEEAQAALAQAMEFARREAERGEKACRM